MQTYGHIVFVWHPLLFNPPIRFSGVAGQTLVDRHVLTTWVPSCGVQSVPESGKLLPCRYALGQPVENGCARRTRKHNQLSSLPLKKL